MGQTEMKIHFFYNKIKGPIMPKIDIVVVVGGGLVQTFYQSDGQKYNQKPGHRVNDGKIRKLEAGKKPLKMKCSNTHTHIQTPKTENQSTETVFISWFRFLLASV